MSSGLSLEARVAASLRSTVGIISTPTKADGVAEQPRFCGSGVVIAKELVLTCNHVRKFDRQVYAAVAISVGADHTYDELRDYLPGHRISEVVGEDDARDLLLLRVPGLPSDPIELRADEPLLGESLYWVGHPRSIHAGPIVCTGVLAGKHPVPHYDGGISTSVRGFRLDGTAQPGNSGGGLFDLNGRVAGLVCASPLQINQKILQDLLRAQDGAPGKIGGVDLVETVRAVLEDLAATTRTGIAYAISAAELHSALPRLRGGC